VEQNNILRNFQIKAGDSSDKQTFEKLQETGTTAINETAALKAYRISIVFLFCNIHKQTGYYRKEISHLFANFVSCNITKYY